MPKAKNVKYIVEHCSAGYGYVDAILNYHHNILGWKNPGYHVIIDLMGEPHYVHDFHKTANGVRGFNHQCLHLCYIGGVDPNNYKKAIDTRSQFQKDTQLRIEIEMIHWLLENGKTDCHTDLMILGHRDFSPDKNLNGMVDSNERIKECPSYDTIPEKFWIGATSQKQLLPFNRK